MSARPPRPTVAPRIEFADGRPQTQRGTHLRSESLESLAVGELVALGLGVGKDDGVRALAVVGDDVLQHARPMAGGHLDRQVLDGRCQLVDLRSFVRSRSKRGGEDHPSE